MLPQRSRIKVAYGSTPKDCGTFTFYRNLREGLRVHGIDLFCLTAGRQEAQGWDEAFVDDACVRIACDESDPMRQARASVAWMEQEGIDLVMPVNSVALLSALPHLPPRTRAVMRCANAFDHGYRITVLCQERAGRIVATTPRHVRDLTTAYGANPGKVTLIPHGIDPGPFEGLPARRDNNALTLGFLGRLEHNQKGVLHLPGIVEQLRRRGIPFTLKIAGTGVHRPRLEKLMAGPIAGGMVAFPGRLTPAQVPAFLADIDVFLFPSRFEGFGFSLIEAMMAGCAPVASRIEAITDFILEDGRTGLLCDIGDEAAFAEAIARLHADRPALKAMSAAAARAARERFTVARMAADYARVFDDVVSAPLLHARPAPWSEFHLPEPFQPTWRSLVPRPLKKLARTTRDTLRWWSGPPRPALPSPAASAQPRGF